MQRRLLQAVCGNAFVRTSGKTQWSAISVMQRTVTAKPMKPSARLLRLTVAGNGHHLPGGQAIGLGAQLLQVLLHCRQRQLAAS